MTFKYDVFRPYDQTPTTDYPLTRGELLALADHWWDELLEVEVDMTLMAAYDTWDAYRSKYAAGRLELLLRHLGPVGFAHSKRYAYARWRQHLGEKYWTAFCEGRPLVRDETEASSSTDETSES